MHQLHANFKIINKDTAVIDDLPVVHHLRDVLRLKPKDEIRLIGRDLAYIAEITGIGADKIMLKVKSALAKIDKKGVFLTIACAIPKKGKFDEIVDKLTQLGADEIIPLLTERVIVRIDKSKAAERLSRWRKIALNASEQSKRDTLPVIAEIKSLAEVINGSGGYDLKLIPHLSGAREGLKEIITKASPKSIITLIGPEGDFSGQEIALAIKSGFTPVSLGSNILRVDTAAIAVTGFIKLYIG